MPLNKLDKRIRVVLADDDAMFRGMCRNLVSPQIDLEVAAETATADEIAGIVARENPDVLVLGMNIGGRRGFEVLEQLNSAKLAARVIAVCEHGKHDDLVRAVRLGSQGVLTANTPPELILKSLRKVHEGELWLGRVTAAEVLRQFTQEMPAAIRSRERNPKASPLSPREKEIVQLVVQGFKNKELAGKLVISEQTVKNHMHNIFDKLGVSDRLELALYAIHNGLHQG